MTCALDEWLSTTEPGLSAGSLPLPGVARTRTNAVVRLIQILQTPSDQPTHEAAHRPHLSVCRHMEKMSS